MHLRRDKLVAGRLASIRLAPLPSSPHVAKATSVNLVRSSFHSGSGDALGWLRHRRLSPSSSLCGVAAEERCRSRAVNVVSRFRNFFRDISMPKPVAFEIPAEEDGSESIIKKHPPKRLQRLEEQTQCGMTAEEIDEKQQKAEERRQEILQERVRTCRQTTEKILNKSEGENVEKIDEVVDE